MLLDYLTLCLAAAAAGAINSVAGGGTLLTFPALFAVLGSDSGENSAQAEASVLANGTSTVALFPGSVAGMWGYRRELVESRHWIAMLVAPSLVGGFVGSLLVTVLPATSFKTLVPWLILTAALLFALQPAIARWAGVGERHAPPSRGAAARAIGFQFLVAVYGGYFGAGIGILMLSALAMMGLSDIHRMNGLKTLFAGLINGVAAIVFIVQRKVDWQYAPAMIAAAIVGGYVGAHTARRLDRNLVRRVVVAIGFGLAGWYFYRELGA